MEKIKKEEQKNIYKIETKFYKAVCTLYSITINWENKKNETYIEDKETFKETRPRLYKYSEKELVFYYQNNMYYINNDKRKEIIKNIDMDSWTFDYFDSCKKISMLACGGDPPDYLYIFPVNELINNQVDMEDEKSIKKYLVDNYNAFNTHYRRDDTNYYVIHDDGMDIINVETLKKTSTF